MKPSLQLKFSQQLTMTPQLQQAIKLLQLSTLDLQQEIQEALESNPLLETAEQNADNNQESVSTDAGDQTLDNRTDTEQLSTAKSDETGANSEQLSSGESDVPDPMDTHDALKYKVVVWVCAYHAGWSTS